MYRTIRNGIGRAIINPLNWLVEPTLSIYVLLFIRRWRVLHSRHFKAMQFLYFLTLRKFVFLFISIYKTLTSALLPLLFVTSMPTVQTLSVLICALARLDSPGTEKPARVSKIYTPFETYWKSTWVWVTWAVLNCIMWLLWERFWTSFHYSLVKSEKRRAGVPKLTQSITKKV